jgi:hypothetical protein
MLKRIWLAALLPLLLSGCGFITISKTGGSAERFADYREDLSASRLRFDPLPNPVASIERSGTSIASIDDDLSVAIQDFIRSNEREHFFNGFTILVYSGVDREQAFKTRNKLYSDYPGITTFMQYQEPRYLVKVGRYINRIEALGWYEKINDAFPSARIVQDRFERNLPNQNQDNL